MLPGAATTFPFTRQVRGRAPLPPARPLLLRRRQRPQRPCRARGPGRGPCPCRPARRGRAHARRHSPRGNLPPRPLPHLLRDRRCVAGPARGPGPCIGRRWSGESRSLAFAVTMQASAEHGLQANGWHASGACTSTPSGTPTAVLLYDSRWWLQLHDRLRLQVLQRTCRGRRASAGGAPPPHPPRPPGGPRPAAAAPA